MSANVDAMVREGIRAYRAGNKAEARTLLMKAVELDEFNEQAWLWLSATVETPEEQRTCLENVLIINPNNERAKNGIQMLTAKGGGTPSAPAASPGNAAFGAPDLGKGSASAAGGDDEMPTSLEWDMPATETSSASSFRPVNEPTKQDYDDWVSSLNLGGQAGGQEPAAGGAAFTMTPFTDDDNLFGMEDDEPSLPTPPPPPSRPSVAAATMPPRSSPPPSPRAAPVMSPPPDDDADDLLDDIEDADLDEFDDDFQMSGDDQDPSEYFKLIPEGIKATRLPGEDEKYPGFVPIGIGLLVILNLAAAGLLLFNLIG
jgi:hypothetical protein